MSEEFRGLLKKTLKSHRVEDGRVPATDVFWGPEIHGLEATSWWQDLKNEQRQIFLKSWQIVPLREAFHIERAGMTYSARMSLRARSFEEQSFFNLMAAEECAHFHALSPWFDPTWEPSKLGGFESLILEIIENTGRVESLLLIQVILEGWGLQHYKDLAGATRDPSLCEIFQRILKDEARHHAGGLMLFRPERTKLSRETVRPFIDKLLEFVRIGPWSLLESTMAAGARFSTQEGVTFLTDLRAQEKTAMKIKRLKNLLEKAFDGDLESQKLTDHDFLAPTEAQMWSKFSTAFSGPSAIESRELDQKPALSI